MTTNYTIIRCIIGVFIMLLTTGCESPKPQQIQRAIAVISPTLGNNTAGLVHFYQVADNVKVMATLTGLTPNQNHGFHVHEFGDISAENGTSAGGHYNPEGHPHGLPPNQMRHAGSFGNILADENGNATFELVDDTISIAGQKNPIIGRAVIVHAKKDTGIQPTGGAGARIGMGIVGISK